MDFPAFCYETFAAVGTTFVQKGITTSPTNCVYGPDRFTPENGLAPDYRIDSYGTIRFNAAGECD